MTNATETTETTDLARLAREVRRDIAAADRQLRSINLDKNLGKLSANNRDAHDAGLRRLQLALARIREMEARLRDGGSE